MGLGGYLTWTAAIRELSTKKLPKDVTILPCEITGNTVTKIVKSSVFKNNPYIYSGDLDDFDASKAMILPLNLPQTNYCLEDHPDKAVHRSDKHIIETICEFYEIESPQLKCELYFSAYEKAKAKKDFITTLPEEYVVIEPTSKINYTSNRTYPFYKWQSIVDSLPDTNFVQIGSPGSEVLNNVHNLVGKTTFREAALIVEGAQALVASEGGLTHVATAVDTVAIVVITGYQTEKMVAYPQNININIATHGPCGLKKHCEQCQRDAISHDHGEIIVALSELLDNA